MNIVVIALVYFNERLMCMILISKRKLIIFIAFVILLSSIISYFKGSKTSVFSQSLSKKIVLDAGHGLPDGGAVGINGSIESTLNLAIAKKVEKKLRKKGYEVIMTRCDDNSLSPEGLSIAARKKDDMHKRLEIINSSGADIFVSIHMNKFPDSKYKGAQIIYSQNYENSKTLALCLQERFHKIKNNTSKRSVMAAPKSIFLLKNAQIPAVIAECGFLSNYEEEKLLNDEDYQAELADAIYKGILDYYKNSEINKGV